MKEIHVLTFDVFVSDGFTFVKRHQAALIQRLKSVEPVLEHLREQNVFCKFIFCRIIGAIILALTVQL